MNENCKRHYRLMEDKDPYRKEWMTDAQYECLRCLAHVFRGFHHVPTPRPCGRGIEVNCIGGSLASFDSDDLTRLVFACHDRACRAEIASSGPRLVKIRMWKRTRDGDLCHRHPSLEEAVKTWRERYGDNEAYQR